MKNQPNRDYDSNDVVMTPQHLADRIVKHFRPYGRCLEPCAGDGAFIHAMENYANATRIDWCEITKDSDFLLMDTNIEKYDWIVTNPPWSQIRSFLNHAMKVANNIVFLMTVNHVWTKARIRDIKQAGFSIREICLVEMPDEFPQSGFQLGAIHLSNVYRRSIEFSDISIPTPKSIKAK